MIAVTYMRLPAAFVRSCLILVLFSLSGTPMFAQGAGGRGGPPLTAKQAAQVDLTGYWVAVVTEDWKYRVLQANKGD